jgi:hypothetical protein
MSIAILNEYESTCFTFVDNLEKFEMDKLDNDKVS